MLACSKLQTCVEKKTQVIFEKDVETSDLGISVQCQSFSIIIDMGAFRSFCFSCYKLNLGKFLLALKTGYFIVIEVGLPGLLKN